ncbi:uncharacterized protein LOC134773931 [Penaeus indicus]|uniref:uncharacterized protein LOC134773931 n=1 Tax=Penaeus indicus TaxID=29960 RepID=UPI00300C9095
MVLECKWHVMLEGRRTLRRRALLPRVSLRRHQLLSPARALRPATALGHPSTPATTSQGHPGTSATTSQGHRAPLPHLSRPPSTSATLVKATEHLCHHLPPEHPSHHLLKATREPLPPLVKAYPSTSATHLSRPPEHPCHHFSRPPEAPLPPLHLCHHFSRPPEHLCHTLSKAPEHPCHTCQGHLRAPLHHLSRPPEHPAPLVKATRAPLPPLTKAARLCNRLAPRHHRSKAPRAPTTVSGAIAYVLHSFTNQPMAKCECSGNTSAPIRGTGSSRPTQALEVAAVARGQDSLARTQLAAISSTSTRRRHKWQTKCKLPQENAETKSSAKILDDTTTARDARRGDSATEAPTPQTGTAISSTSTRRRHKWQTKCKLPQENAETKSSAKILDDTTTARDARRGDSATEAPTPQTGIHQPANSRRGTKKLVSPAVHTNLLTAYQGQTSHTSMRA